MTEVVTIHDHSRIDFDRVGDAPLPIHAPSDGYIILQPFQAPIAKGDTMLVIGKDVRD